MLTRSDVSGSYATFILAVIVIAQSRASYSNEDGFGD
jgi:hypothetical protein